MRLKYWFYTFFTWLGLSSVRLQLGICPNPDKAQCAGFILVKQPGGLSRVWFTVDQLWYLYKPDQVIRYELLAQTARLGLDVVSITITALKHRTVVRPTQLSPERRREFAELRHFCSQYLGTVPYQGPIAF